ncbi:hypothetical protein MIMGU_mgv1a015655mg [Erythranthe guttata]|uniref:Uncharacterized protein n=1 Tax=Erythranthe guttata TaxID=4155 RepID=A0A022QYR1_ERYGU|nr:hypothetical protein MIMGU_mgv1a015655mg [Erythranthe guttata]
MTSPALIRFPPPGRVGPPSTRTLKPGQTGGNIPPPFRVQVQVTVVHSSRIRIRQRGVGVADLDEISSVRRRSNRRFNKPRFRVGVVHLGERAVRRLDLHLRRAALYSEDLVQAPVVDAGGVRRHLGYDGTSTAAVAGPWPEGQTWLRREG